MTPAEEANDAQMVAEKVEEENGKALPSEEGPEVKVTEPTAP